MKNRTVYIRVILEQVSVIPVTFPFGVNMENLTETETNLLAIETIQARPPEDRLHANRSLKWKYEPLT